MTSFIAETTFHGFAELDRGGWKRRVVWTAAMVGVIIFFLVGTAGLTGEYINQAPSSTIRPVPSEMPLFSIAPPTENVFTKETLAAAGISVTQNQLVAIRHLYGGRSGRGHVANCDERTYISMADQCGQAVANERAGVEDLIAREGGYTELVKKVANGTKFFDHVGEDDGSFYRLSITPVVDHGGVKFVFGTSIGIPRGPDYTVHIDGMHNGYEEVASFCEPGRVIWVNVGSVVAKLDARTPPSLALKCQHDHTVVFQATKWQRQQQYCDKGQQESEFSCTTDCWITEATRHSSTCIGFVGDSSKVNDDMLCNHPDDWGRYDF